MVKKEPEVKLKHIAKVITPQVGVSLVVKKEKSGEELWSGPAHYLTGSESFCDLKIKSISMQPHEYVITV